MLPHHSCFNYYFPIVELDVTSLVTMLPSRIRLNLLFFLQFHRYLSFVKAVIDSNYFPLNVYREILQESRIVRI